MKWSKLAAVFKKHPTLFSLRGAETARAGELLTHARDTAIGNLLLTIIEARLADFREEHENLDEWAKGNERKDGALIGQIALANWILDLEHMMEQPAKETTP